MRPLRIGVLSYWLPVVGARRSGVERVAHELAQGLAVRGHEVIVWSYDPAPPKAAYAVRPLPYKGFVTSWFGHRVTAGYLGNALMLLPNYRGCDVLISHGDSLLLPILGRPLVRVMHGSALGEALSAKSPWRFAMQMGVYFQEILSAMTQPGCVGVSSNSRTYNPFVRQFILTGVNRQRFRSEPKSKTANPSIVFVGTLDGRKRGAFLLDLFSRTILPKLPNATLDMVGIKGESNTNVRYHVGLTDLELAELYRRSWVYASPSLYEGFGLPYLEAMACGTPVLACPNPGSNEVLGGGEFGLLARDDRFGVELERLLTDETYRSTWTDRGLQRAEQLSLDSMIDRYEGLIRQLLERNGHGRLEGAHVAR